MWQFDWLVNAHIVTGTIGLIAFWVPVVGRKGGDAHIRYGRIFVWSMLATGSIAVLMSGCTLLWPVETHPKLAGHPQLSDPAIIRTVFGWMMQYLGLLTINLAWYSWQCVLLKRDRASMRDWRNLGLQAVLFLAACNVIAQGLLIGQPLLTLMSSIGFATVATNLWFLCKPAPGPLDWLKEHVKAGVGAGISVYTAFTAFGAVRLMPDLALHPGLWAIPLVTGVSIILWHWRQIGRKVGGGRRAATAAAV